MSAPAPQGPRTDTSPARPDPLEALGRFADEARKRYRAKAKDWIRRLGVNAVWFSPDDAINEALFVLCRRTRLGTIRPIPSRADFRRRFPATLKQAIIDRARLQQAARRHMAGTVSLTALEESGCDTIDEGTLGPDEAAISRERFRKILDLLRRGAGPFAPSP